MHHSRAEEALTRLRAWVETTGWSGPDPFDVRAHPLYLRLARAENHAGRAALALLYRLEQRHPLLARRLLRTPVSTNAKGMGLFARGYAMLGAAGDRAADAEASRRLEWLEAHTCDGHPGVSWGYPFDWQSRHFFPAGTPSAVVTATVADAFRYGYARTGDHAELLQGVAAFFAEGLGRSVETPAALCFSYTPIDTMRVHNANVIAGEHLLWAGHAFDEPRWRELGRRALAYTVGDQEPSGAWDYWGPPDRGRLPRTVDPYHTGFVLRMLLRAHATTGDETYLAAARRGFDFLCRGLLTGGRPRATETRPYPVNGHAVAEVLLTCRAFEGLDERAAPTAEALLEWALRHMRSSEGYFHYLWWPDRANRIPMMRWVEAWMFLALAATVTGERHP